MAEADAEMGSTTGARVGHLGAGRDGMTDVEAEDTDDETDYVSIGERSSAACAESMDNEWMVARWAD